MRFSAGAIANVVAWGGIALLIAAALVVAARFGAFGLMLLGAATWLVCLRAAMDEAAPSWSAAQFHAGITEQGAPPEQRAARQAERQALLAPLRFYGRCGMVLLAIGTALLLWQQWGAL